jgi:polyribonucleotide 5'-hydroxyl-kinase
MAIPGLGQIPVAVGTSPFKFSTPTVFMLIFNCVQPAASSTRCVTLQPFWEWRFEVAFGSSSSITVKLLSGKAEKDGTELAIGVPYRLVGLKSKILTYHGCELEVNGPCDDEFVAEYTRPEESPTNAYLNLHFKLTALRTIAAQTGTDGPRIMIAGPANTGKTTLARTLAAYAVRMGEQPLVVNTDPRHGMLTLPGTLSASVFATVMDIESGDGWGSTPSSGPSTVPVKLPLVFEYGYSYPEEDAPFYGQLVTRLSGSVTARFRDDPAVRIAGMIIDTPRVSEKSKTGLDCLAHIAEELSGTALAPSNYRQYRC